MRNLSLWLISVVAILFAPGTKLVAQPRWTPPIVIDTAVVMPTIYVGGEMALDDSGTIYTIFSSWRSNDVFVARSTDGGGVWMKHSNADSPETLRVARDIAVDHLGNVWILWISTDGGDFDPYYLNLSKSTDGGSTFAVLFRSYARGNGFFPERVAVDDQNSVYMLWDDQQFKLTRFQFGDMLRRTDTEIPNDSMSFGSNTCLIVSKDFVIHCIWEGVYSDSNNVYAYEFYSRSNDTGKTFQGRVRADTTISVSPYCDCSDYPSLGVDSMGTVFVSYTKERQIRVSRSTNQGQSFSPPVIISGSDTAYDSKICVDSQWGINILWGSVGHGIRHYRSSDGGLSFSQFAPFPRIGSSSFKAGRNGFLYAAGPNDSGFGFARTNVILSVSSDQFSPGTFVLFPNYPNPFNPSTEIQFDVPKSSFVTLRVYNLLGQEIAVLVNEERRMGHYQVQFNGSNHPSGIYFYRLTAGNYSAVRKMVLMK